MRVCKCIGHICCFMLILTAPDLRLIVRYNEPPMINIVIGDATASPIVDVFAAGNGKPVATSLTTGMAARHAIR